MGKVHIPGFCWGVGNGLLQDKGKRACPHVPSPGPVAHCVTAEIHPSAVVPYVSAFLLFP